MSKPRSCYCGKPRCAGGQFPDCGCAYTTKDDGVHFCPLHAAAPALLAACERIQDIAPLDDGSRIVACINACAGLPTDALEAGIVQDLVDSVKLFVSGHGLSVRKYQALFARVEGR